MMKRKFNHWLLALVVSLAVGCGASMRRHWKAADSAHTIEAYEEFLHHYPEGEFAELARMRLANLRWKAADSAHTIEAYEEFLRHHPEGALAKQARLRLALAQSEPLTRTAYAIPLKGITIDGKMDDWPEGVTIYPIAWVSKSYKPTPPEGPEDLSASFRVGYDAQQGVLYVLVVVRDDELVVCPENPHWDNQDDCDIYIDGDHSGDDDGSQGARGAQQYAMVPGASVFYARVDGNPALCHGETAKSGMRGAFRRVGDVTIYEWSIPLFERYPDRRLIIQPGQTIGFDVAVADADGTEKNNWVTWTPEANKAHNSDLFGDLTFVLRQGQRPAVCDAGSDQAVNVGDPVTLDGSGSRDPDGDTLSYVWTQTYGPSVTLSGATTVKPTFVPTKTGVYLFSLVVNDGEMDSYPDAVRVTVLSPMRFDISGTWLLYITPQGGAEHEPDCVYIHQRESYMYYSIWRHEFSISVNGTIMDSDLELSGEGIYYGESVSFSASATTDGNTITGTYSYTGAYAESGTWRAERSECKKSKAWIRTLHIQNQGYGINFGVWDLIREGITFTSASVTGPHIDTISLDGGSNEYSSWGTNSFLGETKPTAGDIYTFTVDYSDGTSETVTASVRDIFVDFPTPISPADGGIVNTNTPVFSWQPPPCECQGYYRVWVVDSRGNGMWSVYPSKEITSVVYNSNGRGSLLSPDETYEWRLIAFDERISGGPDNNVWVSSSFTVQTDILVSPTFHAFGNVSVGSQSVVQRFSVTNTGTEDVVIGVHSLTGTDASEFRIQNDRCSNQTIAPSDTCTFDVVFLPTSTGSKEATLTISSNDPEPSRAIISLTGWGVRIRTVSLPDTTASSGDILRVALTVDDATSIAGVEATISFDSNILYALEVHATSPTGACFVADNVSSNQVKFRLGRATGTVSGRAALAEVVFQVVGASGDSTTLSLERIAWWCEEGPEAIPALAQNGSVKVIGPAR